jgi:hypothetical protein
MVYYVKEMPKMVRKAHVSLDIDKSKGTAMQLWEDTQSERESHISGVRDSNAL